MIELLRGLLLELSLDILSNLHKCNVAWWFSVLRDVLSAEFLILFESFLIAQTLLSNDEIIESFASVYLV